MPRVSKSAGDDSQLNAVAGYKSLRSPSVSASNQTESSSAALADSSGTDMEEEEEEEEEEKEEEGVRRKSASSTSCLLDAATNTSGETGETQGSNMTSVTFFPQSRYVPRVPQCLSPRPNWDSPTPSPASECASPPPRNQRGREYTFACV
jgi:hypothetical protein